MKKFPLFSISIFIITLLNLNVSPAFASQDVSMSFDDSGDSSNDGSSNSFSSSADGSDDDSSGWSDGPPGGSADSGTSVATLITSPTPPPATLTSNQPPSSTSPSSAATQSNTLSIITLPATTVPAGSGPSNHPFADLYSSLINLQGALLQSINVYWNTTNPPQAGNGCAFSNLPTSVNSIMQGHMGPYFGAVFMPGSLPLQIIRTIQQTLIAYVQGMTKQLTIDTYNASSGNDFVSFIEPQLNGTPGTFTGNLAYVDQVWKNTYSIVNATFDKLRSGNKLNNLTIKFIQNTLQTIADTYTRARYQTIITWYTQLVSDLAQRYNPTNFAQGLFSYTSIPNSSALTGYSNAFIDACAQLTHYYSNLTTAETFSVGTLSLAINQQVTPSDTVFTNPQTFFTSLQNNTLNNLGDICAYVASVGMQRATDIIQNKQIPTPTLAPVITYNTLQDVPTFLTSTQTGALQPLPYFPGTQIPTSPDFYCAQQLYSALSGYVTGALDAFNFDTNPSSAHEIFVYDSLSPMLAQTYESEGLNAPATMLQNLQSSISAQDATFQKLQQRVTASTPHKVALVSDTQNLIVTDFHNISDVFQQIIIACSASLDAQYWYTQSGNTQAATIYSTQATLLQNIASAWKGGCALLSSAQNQPSNQSYQIYSQAGDLFYKSGAGLLTLNLLPLNAYALTLGAYLKVTSYQALVSYYASYYGKSLTTYNRYLQTPPAYSYSNGQYNFDIVPGYEKALFMIVYYIDQALSTAMTGYQNQLSFFLSQKKDNSDYLSLIWPIQDALLLLTNFQEAITPLLLQMPCGTTTDNKALVCGVDYNLIQATATNVAEQDIAALIIKAHNQYTATYPLFKSVDAIMQKYPSSSPQYKSLQQYTSLDSLFQLSANKLNFSEFFLLHQARLYTSVAQRLITGKPFFWQQGDVTKSQGSAYALLLYAYAAAIYQHLGYTQHAQTVSAMKHLLFSPALVTSFKDTIAQTLATSLHGKTSAEINQMYQELNALCTVLYLSPGDTTQFQFLEMLSHTIIHGTSANNTDIKKSKNKDTSKQVKDSKPTQNSESEENITTLGDYGYADWLASNPNNIDDALLHASLMYYQGGLIAQERKDVHADTFFHAAQTTFNTFIHTIDELVNTHIAALRHEDSESSTHYYQSTLTDPHAIDQQLQAIKKLVTTKDAYDVALYQMDFLQSVFTNTTSHTKLSLPTNISSTCSQFLQGGLNLPGIIGDVYFTLGNQTLGKIQQSISQTLGQDLTQDFATIIDYYTQAKNFYGTACISDSSYQEKFLEAEHALSDAYAYQSYASVIPLFTITDPTLTVPQKASVSLPAFTIQSMTRDQAVHAYANGDPLFLLRQHTISVPPLIAQSFKQDSTDTQTLLKGIATPLYSFTLFSQLQDQTSKATMEGYINQFTKNYTSLCTAGITVANQTLRGSLAYTAKNTSLQSSYEPLPAIPRFSAEIASAIAYYSDGCGKLYANSSAPIDYHGQLLIPSNNLAGQDLTNKAILNTYLSRAVELTKQIAALKQDKKFLFLQSASLPTRVKQNFYDYLPLYKQLQDPYEELIGLYLATNSFLSHSGISASACSEIIAQTIIEWMETNSTFLCGLPDMTAYRALLHNLLQSAQQIQKYANQVAQGEQYSTHAAILFTSAYEYCAQAFAITPDIVLSTTNPDTGALYPAIPSFLPTCMRWKDAGTYYTYAGDFLGKIMTDTLTFSSAAKSVLTEKMHSYYSKAVTHFLQYSTFNAALFCSNAFQECRCSLANGTFNTIQLEQLGDADSPYPPWDYPYAGYIPQVTPPTYYTYPVCQLDPSTGSSYTFGMPPAVYQGVASMEVPSFATAKIQSCQGQQSQYSSMYSTMQQIFLNALYYYQESINLMKKLIPSTKVSPATKKAREVHASHEITAWIIVALNKNPGFYNPYTKQGSGLPVINIQTTSQKSVTLNGKTSQTLETVYLFECADLDISLANPRQLYLHTLRYWSSRTDFYSTLLSGLFKWCTPGNYDIAQTFLMDVIQMFESFFIHSYMPSLNSSDAQYQVQEMIQNSQQDSSGTSAGYF